jgi:hypothetical protein
MKNIVDIALESKRGHQQRFGWSPRVHMQVTEVSNPDAQKAQVPVLQEYVSEMILRMTYSCKPTNLEAMKTRVRKMFISVVYDHITMHLDAIEHAVFGHDEDAALKAINELREYMK